VEFGVVFEILVEIHGLFSALRETEKTVAKKAIGELTLRMNARE
jgi:hypothetical protein